MDEVYRRLRDRLKAERAAVFVGIVVIEESMQGWMALLKHCTAGTELEASERGGGRHWLRAFLKAMVVGGNCAPNVAQRPGVRVASVSAT